MTQRALRAALATGCFVFLTACAVEQPAVVHQPPPPPPAPAEVIPAAPGPGYVWMPGYWSWRGPRRGYAWVPGAYTVPAPPAYAWVPGHWAERPGGWVWVEGHWRGR